MLVYNPNDSNIYSKEYREERNKILMNRMLKLHIQKLQLQKWEHGKPVDWLPMIFLTLSSMKMVLSISITTTNMVLT